MRLTIGAKLLGGFIIGALVTAEVGLIGIYALSRIQANMTDYKNLGVELRDHARLMDIAMLTAPRNEKDC